MFGMSKGTIDETEAEKNSAEDSASNKISEENNLTPQVQNIDDGDGPILVGSGSTGQSSSSIFDWAKDSAQSFLDIMDITDVVARRKALLSIEGAAKEENLISIISISDAYIFLLEEFSKNAFSSPPQDILDEVATYSAKSKAMKAWIGL